MGMLFHSHGTFYGRTVTGAGDHPGRKQLSFPDQKDPR